MEICGTSMQIGSRTWLNKNQGQKWLTLPIPALTNNHSDNNGHDSSKYYHHLQLRSNKLDDGSTLVKLSTDLQNIFLALFEYPNFLTETFYKSKILVHYIGKLCIISNAFFFFFLNILFNIQNL